MAFYENGLVRICYEDLGTGVPLLLIAGGGLNGTTQNLRDKSPFNPVEQFSGKYRCIMMDLRNANTGKSSGPLEIERPWDAYSDDQISLMDHLGIDKFMVLGFCIGGPFIWNLLRRIPDRVVAAVLVQPSGFRPEIPDLFYQNNIESWAPQLCKNRPDISMEMAEEFLEKMYDPGKTKLTEIKMQMPDGTEKKFKGMDLDQVMDLANEEGEIENL